MASSILEKVALIWEDIWAVVKKLEWLIPDEKSDEEQKTYNDEYNRAYQEFMDSEVNIHRTLD